MILKLARLAIAIATIAGSIAAATVQAVANPAIVTVSTAAQFQAALKSALAGNVIKLAPGTYNHLIALNVNFTTPVTITSADPRNPALLVGLGVANATGVTFTNLELTSVGSTDAYYAFRMANTTNITFVNNNIHGDVNGVPGNQLMGFYLNTCTNTNFLNNNFHHLNLAILSTKATGLNITGNQFSYLNKSGIQLATTSNVTIASNQFTNFKLTPGTHPDMIQYYTAGTTEASHDITITGNLFYRGSGDVIQGIFIKDETGHLPYHGLNITNNAIIGGMWNSIYLANVGSDTHVNSNVAATWAGADVPGNGTALAAFMPVATTNFQGWIFVSGDAANQSGVLLGNRAQAYLDPNGKSMKPPPGNTLIGAVTDQGAALLHDWQATHASGTASQGVLLH